MLLTGVEVDIAEWDFGPGAVSVITDWYSRFTSDHHDVAREGFEDVGAEAVEQLVDFLADARRCPLATSETADNASSVKSAAKLNSTGAYRFRAAGWSSRLGGHCPQQWTDMLKFGLVDQAKNVSGAH